MDPAPLEDRLRRAFAATDAQYRVVVRQAGDLHDDGRYAATHGGPLTVDDVVENLEDAPQDLDLVERWNWWMGALHLAHGGFQAYRIHRYAGDDR